MSFKHTLLLLSVSIFLFSCWKLFDHHYTGGTYYQTKVWGYKPVYGTEINAKTITFIPGSQPVLTGGNIYAFQHYIFQIDPGRGIHVIDNTIPSEAHRIGFISVRGCSQMSVKNDKLYTNCYDDLVVLDVSDINNVREYSRINGVFSEYKYDSPLAQPPVSGYYECPRYDSLVIGWVQDSVYQSCYKN